MGLKSGVNTSGAQHLASLVNSADGIRRFVPDWDIKEIAKKATEKWLQKQLCKPVDINLLIDSLLAGNGFGDKTNLSLAQWYEAAEQTRVTMTLDNEEKLHIASNSGPANGWVSAIPLTF